MRKWLRTDQDRFAFLLFVWIISTTLLWDLSKVGSPFYHAGTAIGIGGFLVAYLFSLYQAIRKLQTDYLELMGGVALVMWLVMWIYLWPRGWPTNPVILTFLHYTIMLWILPFSLVQIWAINRAKRESKKGEVK